MLEFLNQRNLGENIDSSFPKWKQPNPPQILQKLYVNHQKMSFQKSKPPIFNAQFVKKIFKTLKTVINQSFKHRLAIELLTKDEQRKKLNSKFHFTTRLLKRIKNFSNMQQKKQTRKKKMENVLQQNSHKIGWTNKTFIFVGSLYIFT